MIDSEFQALSTVGSLNGTPPRTVASAATIAPTTFLSMISGNTAIATITPPIPDAHHTLAFVFTHATPVAFTTTGNVATVATPTTSVPIILIYNPLTAKYYVK